MGSRKLADNMPSKGAVPAMANLEKLDLNQVDLKQLDAAIRYEGGVSRRLFLAYSASLSAVPLLGRVASGRTSVQSFAANPFSVGVASGDPNPSGMVLWTRLAPKPLEPGGGLAPEPIDVAWEIAADDGMQKVIQRGTTTASPQLGHTVHVEVDGLAPDRWYFYRFRAGDAESPVGRTRTMPAADASPEKMQIAYASCQHYEAGYYTAYEHMAQDDIDLVFHLGDYIYEGPTREGGVRKHVGKEVLTLDDYRIRHSLYKSDPALQAMHARCPWMVTWDDHELDNNCAGGFCEHKEISPAEFLKRRAGAYQAYYEMMPLRATSLPTVSDMQLYRKVAFGNLAEFLVLDTRQYRTDQPNGDRLKRLNAAATSPKNTILGQQQRGWVEDSLAASAAKWNVLAQQVMMGTIDLHPQEDKRRYSMDHWSGYLHERLGLMKYLADRQISNPVILTGDIHSNWVNNLRVDDRHDDQPIVATEFVGTSISSGSNKKNRREIEILKSQNPCVQFFNAQRGYVRCTITPEHWQTDFRVVDDVTQRGGAIETTASYVVEAGTPGAKPA
jgi:alkaline phosphatase D